MIVKNATAQDLEKALAVINKKYENNVRWNRVPEAVGRRFRFTLRVTDSRKAGARRGFTGRRLINACWHTHGDFFDALFEIAPDAVVKSGGNDITRDYGNWHDSNVGSILSPLRFSEACECEA